MNAKRLTNKCLHLLGLLDRPGAFARVSPIDGNCAIVAAVHDGISVGGGSFALSAVELLRKRDLVRKICDGKGRQIFAITEAGRAYLKRNAAGGEVAFLAQHQDLVGGEVEVDGVKTIVTLDCSEGPLDWLRRRKDHGGLPLIDDASHTAGERLRRDLTLAMMVPSVTTNWENGLSGGVRSAPGEVARASDA